MNITMQLGIDDVIFIIILLIGGIAHITLLLKILKAVKK